MILLLLSKETIDSLASESLKNEEFLLDVPFTAEEVGNAVNRLKRRKAPGPDHRPDKLLAEHLIDLFHVTSRALHVPFITRFGVQLPHTNIYRVRTS